MTSHKQRRVQREAKRRAREARRARKLAEMARFQAVRLGGLRVDRDQLGPNPSVGSPEFVRRGNYVDLPFDCQTCGAPQVWTAAQQKWWYEVAKGNVWTTARLCRPCRRAERARREAARRVHLEGVARKGERRRPDRGGPPA